MSALSDIIANTPAGGTAVLPAGEYEGPVVIGKPLTLRGNGATVWAKHGSVISVAAQGVSLEGLRVEITEGALSEPAITAQFPANVRDVEVLGTVSGFGAEDGECGIPRAIQLGELSQTEENSFRLTVDIPAPARLVCNAAGVRFEPQQLPAGRSEVRLFVSGSGTASMVYSEVLVESQFRRRIYLSGRFRAGSPAVKDRLIYESPHITRSAQSAPDSVNVGNVANAGNAVNAAPAVSLARETADVITDVGSAPLSDGQPLELTKGQRVPAAGNISGRADVYLTGQRLGDADIDPYVFLLDETEKCRSDGGLVFFGNESSPDGAVRYYPDDGHVSVDFGRISPEVKRIAVAYSVYSGDSVKNFSQVREPRISLFSQGKERVRFDITGLTNEITIIAMEFYIYRGEWRISAVGAGYREGLVKLCSRYGIEAST